jgi:hypothetical protein
MSEHKRQNHPPDALKSPKNPAIPAAFTIWFSTLNSCKLLCQWTYQRKIPWLRAQYLRIFLYQAHATGTQTIADGNITKFPVKQKDSKKI